MCAICANIRLKKNAKEKINFFTRKNILFNINVDFSFRPIPVS